jgi:phospholipid/cholesterol/gamma-HCH transport system permease protein
VSPARNGYLLEGVRRLGAVALFLLRLLVQCVPALGRPRLLVQQIYNAGARSLIIIMLSGLFVGMVLGLQGYDLLRRFGSEEALGTAAALGLLRELAPVITALLFAGRAGTSLTSEIGLMRATDQLTAMEMMAVDPLRYVAAPRFLGGVIAMPLLTAIFSVIGLYGAQLVGVQLMGVDRGVFWSQTQDSVALHDVSEGLVKSVVFGIACSLIAVYEGYNAAPHAHRGGLVRDDSAARLCVDCGIPVRGTLPYACQSNSRDRNRAVCVAGICRAAVPHHAAAGQWTEVRRRQGRL